MKFNTYLLTCLSSVFLLFSCNKEKQRITYVENVNDIEYNKATVHTISKLPKKENCYGGLCWGEADNPTIELGNVISDDRYVLGYKTENNEYYYLEGLESETTYYVRSFMNAKGGLVYSETKSFVTASMPEPPCVTNSGTVDFDYFVNEMSNLSLNTTNTGLDDVLYTSSGDYGYFRMFFKDIPTTGIYNTVSFGDVETFNEIAIDFYGGSYNCYYQTYGYNNVYVVNKNGNLTIKFCELPIATNMGLCASDFVLNASLHN